MLEVDVAVSELFIFDGGRTVFQYFTVETDGAMQYARPSNTLGPSRVVVTPVFYVEAPFPKPSGVPDSPAFDSLTSLGCFLRGGIYETELAGAWILEGSALFLNIIFGPEGLPFVLVAV